MSDWINITILATGLEQRVRKSAISAFGRTEDNCYVIKDGHVINVEESYTELKAELEEQ